MTSCDINLKSINNGFSAYIYVSKMNDRIIKQIFVMKPTYECTEIDFINFIRKDPKYITFENAKNIKSLDQLELPFIPYGKYIFCDKNINKYYVIEMLKCDGNVFDIIETISKDDIFRMLDTVYKGLMYLKEKGKYQEDTSFSNIFYKKEDGKYNFVIADNSLKDKPNNKFIKKINAIEGDAIIYFLLKTYKFREIMDKVKEINKFLFFKYIKFLKKATEIIRGELGDYPNSLIRYRAERYTLSRIKSEHMEILDKIMENHKDVFEKIIEFKKNIFSYDIDKFKDL